MFDDYAVNSSHERNWWKKLAWKPRGSRKQWALILIVLLVSVTIIGDQFLNTPGRRGLTGGTSPIDPLVGIWGDDGSAQLSNWNTLLASYSSTMGHLGAGKSIKLSPNTTNTAVALTKNPIGDLSVISGKELYMLMTWTADSWNIFQPIGFYLTTNKTLPVAKYYDPLFDPSVAFLVYTAPDSPNFISRELVQRSPGVSLNTNDIGEFDLTGCGNSGTCYLGVRAASMNPLPGGDAFPENSNALLNFTGPSPGPGGVRVCNNVGTGTGCSYVQLQASYNATAKLPQLPFQGVSYYLGVYAFTSLNPFNPAVIYYGFDGSAAGGVMQADYYVPTATTVSTAPNIDTGGFFGSLIKGLVIVATWAIQAIMLYFGIILQGVALFLNMIGNFFGAGNIGTALVTFLNGIGSWFLNVVGGGFARIGDLATAAANMISFIAGLFTNGFWNMITGFVSNIISFFGTFKIFWDGFVHLLAVAGLGFSYFFMLDWIYGMWQVRSFGAAEGIGKWFDFNEFLFIKTFRGVYFVVKESAEWIRDIKQTVDPIG